MQSKRPRIPWPRLAVRSHRKPLTAIAGSILMLLFASGCGVASPSSPAAQAGVTSILQAASLGSSSSPAGVATQTLAAMKAWAA